MPTLVKAGGVLSFFIATGCTPCLTLNWFEEGSSPIFLSLWQPHRGLIYFPYTPQQPRAWQEALPRRNEAMTLSLDISPHFSVETMSIGMFSINTLTLTHTPQDCKKAVTYPIYHLSWCSDKGVVVVVGVIKATVRTSIPQENQDRVIGKFSAVMGLILVPANSPLIGEHSLFSCCSAH